LRNNAANCAEGRIWNLTANQESMMTRLFLVTEEWAARMSKIDAVIEKLRTLEERLESDRIQAGEQIIQGAQCDWEWMRKELINAPIESREYLRPEEYKEDLREQLIESVFEFVVSLYPKRMEAGEGLTPEALAECWEICNLPNHALGLD
jgi:hypothetical protein